MTRNESIVEEAALSWFADLGYTIGRGPQLAPREPAAARDSFGKVVLVGRLRESIRRMDPAIPPIPLARHPEMYASAGRGVYLPK